MFVFLFRLAVIFLFTSHIAWSKPSSQTLVVPSCLLSASLPYKALGHFNHLSLIQISDLDRFHVNRMQKNVECRGFINVTDEWRTATASSNAKEFLQRYVDSPNVDFTNGHRIQYQSIVTPLFRSINTDYLREQLRKIARMPSRHVNSEQGIYATNWLKNQIETMLASAVQKDVHITAIPTINHARQPSIVVKIGQSNEPGILVGTHIDTLQPNLQQRLGVYEVGSGIVTMLETTRVLLNSPLNFKKPIYLVWYAGQEEGSLGVQSVIREFNRQHIAIDAVLQLDDTAFVGQEPSIGLTDDLTDASLTTLVADLVTTYLRLPVGAISCGFACSDHTAWHQNGTRVAYPFTTMNEAEVPLVHKAINKLKTTSVAHMQDFVKLALAFAVELAEPVGL